MRRILAGALLALLILPAAAFAQDAARIVHLLDYIGVDYGGAVADGKVANAGEYREMVEFAGNVENGIEALPPVAARDALAAGGRELRAAVEGKAAPAEVAAAALALRNAVVVAYQVPLGPPRAPDLGRGAALYQEHCSGCHGELGDGAGPLARGLDPAPANFRDAERQRQRSLHGLYNAITLGVEGTSMPSFARLPGADRWSLAYRVGGWGVTDAEAQSGEAAWKRPGLRALFSSQASLAGRSRAQVADELGVEAASAAAWLVRSPAAIDQVRPDPITFARDRIAASAAHHRQGRAAAARDAALAAYLEGFELAENGLSVVEPALVRRIEGLMGDYRAAIEARRPADDVTALAAKVDQALGEAQATLASSALSAPAAAAASFVILLREGLEAVLVVAALAAFLRRGGQTAALPYLHAGWIGALLLGLVTWAAATWLIEVSGAGREMTEGITALVAAAMLIYVGFWLHDKSHAQAWQRFLMSGAKGMKAGAAWGLAGVAFLAVYREVFEVVLFYRALATQAPDQVGAIVAGIVAAALVLLAVSAAMLRFSVRLPLGLFFGGSGVLLAVIGVILVGSGVAALQEAGTLPIHPFGEITVRWLGIHPTREALAAQLFTAAIVVSLFAWSRLRARPAFAPPT